jgi:hypothetical protein
MRHIHVLVAALSLLAFASLAGAQALDPALPEGYINVSEIVPLPDFIPGVGALYIHPDNAPVGPWLAYGNDGKLVEVLFMVPVSEMQESANWEGLATGTFGELGLSTVDHVDVNFNGGHPGMAEAHYHIRLVLIDHAAQQAALTE